MSVQFDDREVQAAFKRMTLNVDDMRNIMDDMATVVTEVQNRLVPVDEGETRDSIDSYIQLATATEIVSHVGPTTKYSPTIEFGDPTRPQYPKQPFVRPSIFGREAAVTNAANEALRKRVKARFG